MKTIDSVELYRLGCSFSWGTMTTNPFHSRFCLLLLLVGLAFGAVGCSTKVRIGQTEHSFFSRPVDLGDTKKRWAKIQNRSASPEDIAVYNENVRDAVSQILEDGAHPAKPGRIFTSASGDVPISIRPVNVRGFDQVDELLIADTIVLRKGITDTAHVDGVGVPMLARIQQNPRDPLVPDEGLWIPVTGYLNPNGKPLALNLVETTRGNRSHLNSLPFAANFSAPLGRDFFDRQQDFEKLKALINYEKFSRHMGITRVFNFDSRKTPVVLVHGIFSSAATWTHTLNYLMADPVIRDNFEFWLFAYPTGAPIPYLSSRLREDVEKMYAFRRANGARNQEMILVGHSMGGLMGKTLTQHSGDKQWRKLFQVSPGQLKISPEHRDVLRKMFFFEPLPYLDRVVFTATPHWGTETASLVPVNVLNETLITPKVIQAAVGEAISLGPQVFTPLGMEIAADFPTSIEHMRRGSELGGIFADLPLNPRVKYHTIVGSRKGLDVPREEMTDGAVEYEGSHIQGIVSEKIVHSGHGVHVSQDGMAEIARILKLSL